MTAKRVLAFDTSLGRPGAAVVEFTRGKPKVVAVSHVSTVSTQPMAERFAIVEAWALLFINEHKRKGFDIIGREDFTGMSSLQEYPVFSAWAATEQAVHKHGLSFDKYVYYTKAGKLRQAHGVGQARAKSLVVGKGRAEKSEVADAVRKLTGYKGVFAVDDESDAACIALAYGIQAGYMPDVHGVLNRYETEGLK